MKLRVPLTTLCAWMFSSVVHAMGLCVAILLAADFSVVPRVAPFRWDVTLVAASPPELISSDVPTPPLASPTPAMPATKESFIRTIPPAVEQAPALSRAIIDHAVPATNGPILQNTRLQSSTEVSLQAKESTNALWRPADLSHQEPREESQMPAEVVWPGQSSTPLEVPSPAVEAADQPYTPMEPVVLQAHRLVNLPAAQFRPTPVSRQVQPDYGWLASLVATEAGHVKRYPAQAKWHRWQGNVVIQAIIHKNRDISDIQVVNSSGYDSLDHDAITLLARISPLQLQYPLDQSSIVVRFPIGYRLE